MCREAHNDSKKNVASENKYIRIVAVLMSERSKYRLVLEASPRLECLHAEHAGILSGEWQPGTVDPFLRSGNAVGRA